MSTSPKLGPKQPRSTRNIIVRTTSNLSDICSRNRSDLDTGNMFQAYLYFGIFLRHLWVGACLYVSVVSISDKQKETRHLLDYLSSLYHREGSESIIFDVYNQSVYGESDTTSQGKQQKFLDVKHSKDMEMGYLQIRNKPSLCRTTVEHQLDSSLQAISSDLFLGDSRLTRP